ncbi:hypothetical protein E2C01_094059 [Portunus trituberculatus]|uniref:Uncharacterized protein n=1 Tax=Portunus trituberculatus TaxID=210409 RepID=A0A5B7JV64_PORTR|nr:hypothetical protein [Portunus trituberculatus]
MNDHQQRSSFLETVWHDWRSLRRAVGQTARQTQIRGNTRRHNGHSASPGCPSAPPRWCGARLTKGGWLVTAGVVVLVNGYEELYNGQRFSEIGCDGILSSAAQWLRDAP